MKGPQASLPTGLRLSNYDGLALAVTAATFLVKPLKHAARVGCSRSNGASKEGQCDKRGYNGLHGHSPSSSESISAIAVVVRFKKYDSHRIAAQCCKTQGDKKGKASDQKGRTPEFQIQ